MRIDLNADVGESPNGEDAALMEWVTSANVAAGVHAGDPSLLRETVRRARAAGVAVGAHPGLADRESLGRRERPVSPADVEDLVLYQVAAVAGVAAAEGVRLRHVKLHGALYNMAARDWALAAAAARAVSAFDRTLVMFGLAGSALVDAARAEGLATAAEAFADRAYEPDGSLVSRTRPGALITETNVIVARAIRLVRNHEVEAIDGSCLSVRADTLCLHADTPGSAAIARQLRRGLEAQGVIVRPPGAPREGRDAAPSR